MAFLKFSSNLFLGLPELKFLKESLDDQGFRRYIKENSATFGLVQNFSTDPTFNNGKVEEGTNSGTIKVSQIFGIDSDALFISGDSQDLIAVPSSPTQWYWVRIKHKYSNLESGKVSISTNGTLTGTGTNFLSRLRGQPNYPSKISFPDSSNNIQEYQVLRVIDDQNAIISGSFTVESDLKYSIVGTFTPGVPVPINDKFPFQKDYYELELVAEQSLGVEPSKTSGKEFWLARVRNNSGALLIEDKRNEIWQTANSFPLNSRFASNKFIGVEAVKWQNQFDTQEENQIEIGWGLRTENHTASATLRQITISNGEGGLFKKDDISSPFINGDFDGWRVYFKNGKYSIITDSVIDAGAIKVTLDKFDPSDYNASDELFICPDIEEVILRFRNDVSNDDISLYDQAFSFPVNTPKCVLRILVPSATTYSYNVTYRHKNNNQYSQYLQFPDGSFYDESSFDEEGNLKTDPGERNIVNYSGDPSNGYIIFTASATSYYNTLIRIDKGDKYGVRFRELSNASPLISVRVGDDEFNQQVQNLGALNMSVNQIINLRSDGARPGSEFFFYIKGPFITSNGDYTIEFREDYISAGSPGTLKYAVDNGSMTNGNIVIFCTYEGSAEGWVVNHVNKGGGANDVGEVKLYSGTLTGKFDNTGLGISPNWFGWALANGQNGTPDLRGRFLVGLDPSNVDYQMGAIGGASSVTLTEAQLPEHRHFVVAVGVTGSSSFDNTQALAQTRNSGGDSNANLGGINTEPSVGISSIAGNNQPHENRPPYYALAFVIKIADV